MFARAGVLRRLARDRVAARRRAAAHRHRAGGGVCAVDLALRSLLHRPDQGDAAARRRALVRHRQHRPRHPEPRHLRHPQHADARAGRRDRRRPDRRRPGHPRRLLPAAGRLDHAAGRRDAGLPRDPDRACGGRDLRRGTGGGGDRARRCHRARCRAGGARCRDRRDGPGIHGSRPRGRRVRRRADLALPDAELHFDDLRVPHACASARSS